MPNGGSNRTSAAAIRQGALPVQNIGAQMPLGKSFRAAGGGVYLLSMTKLLEKQSKPCVVFPLKCRTTSPACSCNWLGKISLCLPDFQVLVRISELVVIAGEARPTEIAEVLAWAQTYREMLALKWTELNERG
jgi:hypothetical protein